MWKIDFRFKYMPNMENLLPIQIHAECGKSTFDSSTCRTGKIYFRFKYMPNMENLLSIQVHAECGKSTFDSSTCRTGKIYFRFKYTQQIKFLNTTLSSNNSIHRLFNAVHLCTPEKEDIRFIYSPDRKYTTKLPPQKY